MGSGLCRRTGEKQRVDAVDGSRLCRKIVFDYAKQWTRCSNNRPKSGERNYTKRHNKRGKTKPVISGPFPADPDRLEGDKWRYVILTRLDTEPPPERPPRTRRRRRSYGRVSARRRPARRDAADGRSLPWAAAVVTDAVPRTTARRRNDGFFESVGRCAAMANGLLS